MRRSEYAENLLHLIEEGTSPYHTVLEASMQLEEAGYERLLLKEEWTIREGGRYYLIHHGSGLFAFTIGEQFEAKDGFRIGAAHGDFPGFRIKPNPETNQEGYIQLNVESYGGVNLSSWLDRPLSVAGRVAIRTDDVFRPDVRLVDVKRPILTIPNVAIHLERAMNKGVELNKQTQMLPIVGISSPDEGSEDVFLNCIANKLGVAKDDILDYELNVYNADAGDMAGIAEEFISAPRLDNLTSVQALLTGIIEGGRAEGINMIAIFDHEEIGSKTKQGAGSTLLSLILKKIYLSLGMSELDYSSAVSESLLMSVDVAHGFHPNYGKKYDPTNRCILNQGFCIKEACSQSYATDSEAVAIVQQICEQEGIAYQKFVNRSDGTSGGTLGSIASAMLPVRTVDIGIPLLAMHSSRELMGAEDQAGLTEYMRAFYSL